MRLRNLLAVGASAALAVGFAAVQSAHAAVTDLGEFTVGEMVNFPFECPFEGNDFFLFLGNTKVDEDLALDSSDGYLFGYPYDTSNLEPGSYSAGIECNDAQGIFDFEFTIVAADPCAVPDTTEIPKGPSRAPHAAPVECQDSGIPLTGSSTTPLLLVGTLAVLVGSGLVIVRRRPTA